MVLPSYIQHTLLLSVLTALLVALLVGLSGCKDGPSGNDTTEYTKIITPTDGSETIASATLYDDDSGETIGTGETTLTRNEGVSLSIRAEADGFQSTTESISFQNGSDEDIVLTEDNPKEVTINYEIISSDGETLEDLKLLVADTLAGESSDGSITLPYGETAVEFCSQAEFYEDACKQITPDENQQLTLENQREMVEITIVPEIPEYTDYNQSPDTSAGVPNTPGRVPDYTAFVLQVGDSTWVDAGRKIDTGNIDHSPVEYEIGEGVATTVEYPAGEPVDISIRGEYFPKEGHEYSSNEDALYRNVAEKEARIERNTSNTFDVSLDHVPACSDGIDNEFADGADKNDPGCMNKEGNYDPQDDVELLHVLITESSTSGYGKLVSGKEGEREKFIWNPRSSIQNFPPSVLEAISLEVEVRVEVSEDQTGEEFALEFAVGEDEKTRDDTNLSGIVSDDESDGWVIMEVPEVTPDFFASGTSYAIKAIHGTKVRGKDPTSGDDDVVFNDDEKSKYIFIQYVFPPEHVENTQQQKTTAKSASRNTRTKVKDKVQ